MNSITLNAKWLNTMPSFIRSPYWLFPILIVLLLALQFRLWYGEGGVSQTKQLKQQIKHQQVENQKLLDKNRLLEAEIVELKKGTETIEERARQELGMVKDNETLYVIPNAK